MQTVKLSLASLLGCFCLMASPALAQKVSPAASAQKPAKAAASPLSGFNSDSKDPYKIDANTLEVLQKDNKAIYAGDVVVLRGKVTTRCSKLVIFFENKSEQKNKAKAQPAAATTSTNPQENSSLKRIECHGPVNVTQEKQTATANLLVYEADIVTLTGNVTVSDGPNVQVGEKLVYNTKSGIGSMVGNDQPGATPGRVRGIFEPGSNGDANNPGKKKDKSKDKDKPATN